MDYKTPMETPRKDCFSRQYILNAHVAKPDLISL